MYAHVGAHMYTEYWQSYNASIYSTQVPFGPEYARAWSCYCLQMLP